jgi:hypothetical protein
LKKGQTAWKEKHPSKLIANFEIEPIAHSTFRGPVDRVFNLIRIDVVAGYLATGQRGEVMRDSSSPAPHIQQMGLFRVL